MICSFNNLLFVFIIYIIYITRIKAYNPRNRILNAILYKEKVIIINKIAFNLLLVYNIV